MSLASQISLLSSRVATEFKTVRTQIPKDWDSQLNSVYTNFDLGNLALYASTTASVTYYSRVVRGAATISSVKLYVNASSGNIAVAVHANSGTDTGALPGTQLASSGTIACPTTVGINTISLGSSVAVSPGMWLALAVDNTSATFLGQSIATAYSGMNHLNVRGTGMCPSTVAGLGGSQRRYQLIGIP